MASNPNTNKTTNFSSSSSSSSSSKSYSSSSSSSFLPLQTMDRLRQNLTLTPPYPTPPPPPITTTTHFQDFFGLSSRNTSSNYRSTALSLNSGMEFEYNMNCGENRSNVGIVSANDHFVPSAAFSDSLHNICSPPNIDGLFSRPVLVDDPIVNAGGDKKKKRMMKNRESAARSRARKQAYTNELEGEVAHLEAENANLKKQLGEAQRALAAQNSSRRSALHRTLTAPF